MRLSLLLASLLISASGIARAENPVVPDTPAGTVLAQWLDAFNSADAGKLLKFKQTFHRSWQIDEMIGWHNAVGGFDLLRVEKSEPLALAVLLQEKEWDRLIRVEITLESAETLAITNMQTRPAPRPADLTSPRLSKKEALSALCAQAGRLAEADRFSGAILIARNGRILLQKGWGFANREQSTPATPETQFRLASAGKMFTAVAILQLAEAGKVSLDGTVGTYLPDYPNKAVAAGVTIRELLRHTGGMGEYFGPEFTAHLDALRTLDDYIQLFGSREPDHPPGTVYSYSSFGFIVLGDIIEKVSGMSYFDHVDKYVFQPAGMTRTGFQPETENVPDRAAGYMVQKGQWTPAAATLPYRGASAGGGYSTVGDLLRFAEALESGRLISKTTLLEATRRPIDPPSGYGYGFEIGGEDALFNYGHDGGAAGMSVRFRVYPKLGYVLIGLSNEDPETASRLIEYYSLRMPTAPDSGF